MKVINATGVIVHTNLGRAPLSQAAIAHMAGIAGGYTNLEYDLERGARGHRDQHAQRLLCRLTGADAAVVVNNNAAATLIALAALGYRPRGADLAGRARRNRRRLPGAGRHGAVGGTPPGGRHHEPYPAVRLRGRRFGKDSRHPPGASIQLQDRRIHRAPGPRRARGPRAPAECTGCGGPRQRLSPICAGRRGAAGGAGRQRQCCRGHRPRPVQRRQAAWRPTGRHHRWQDRACCGRYGGIR